MGPFKALVLPLSRAHLCLLMRLIPSTCAISLWTQTLRITLPLPAVSVFYPVTFSDWHFCYAPLLLHATPLSFRLLQHRSAPNGTAARRTARAGMPTTREAEDVALAELLSQLQQPPYETADAQQSEALTLYDVEAAVPLPPRLLPSTTPSVHATAEMLVRAARALHRKMGALLRAALALSVRLAALRQQHNQPATRAPAANVRLPQGITLNPSCAERLGSWFEKGEGAGVTAPTAQAEAPAPAAAPTSAADNLSDGDFEIEMSSGMRSEIETSSEMSSPTAWTQHAMHLLNDASEQVWVRWQSVLQESMLKPDALLGELSAEHTRVTISRLGESVFREVRHFEDRAYLRHKEPITLVAESLRGSEHYRSLKPPAVRDGSWCADQQPIFFEQQCAARACQRDTLPRPQPCYTFSWSAPKEAPRAEACSTAAASTSTDTSTTTTTTTTASRVHMIVFVHGFHGNSYDLRTMRNHLALTHPEKDSLRFLCSSVNEEHTAHASFEQLGANLASEINDFMHSEHILQSCARVSFVCHSFGSVIARVALSRPDLARLLPLLHTYVSFSGPHLGMLYGSNALVELGMWGLRRWRGAQCLRELCLDDGPPTDTLLYRLSKQPVLSHFRNVLLVSSPEDRYVPHHSARIQLCDEAVHDARYGSVFVAMVHNLLAPLVDTKLLHIDVHFGEPPSPQMLSQLDAAIGRRAHIAFLDNHAFVQSFVSQYMGFFNFEA